MTSYTCAAGRTRLLLLPRRTTRKILALPAPSFDRPQWRPFGQIRQRLAEAEGPDAADHRFLLERCAALEDRLDDVEYVLPPGAIHKDATIGNLLPAPHHPVICASIPPAWDRASGTSPRSRWATSDSRRPVTLTGTGRALRVRRDPLAGFPCAPPTPRAAARHQRAAGAAEQPVPRRTVATPAQDVHDRRHQGCLDAIPLDCSQARRPAGVRRASSAVGGRTRTLAWLTAHRRLARDDERMPQTSEEMIRWAAINQMLRRLTRGKPAARQQRRTFDRPDWQPSQTPSQSRLAL